MPIRIANAPVSWGILEFDEITPKYPFTRVLDEIRDTGYTGLELGPWGYLPTDPEAARPELEKRGLQMLSSYVPGKLVDEAAHDATEAHALQVGKYLAALGAGFIVLADDNCVDPALLQQAGKVDTNTSRLSSAEWDVFAKGVNRIARKLHDETGLKVVFHHHGAGYVETAEETRQLLARCDHDLVGLCLDTGHWHYAGGDAMDAIREYGERVRYLHLKDCDPAARQRCLAEGLDYFGGVQVGLFPELGKGDVDFPAILQAVEALGYDGWAIVEQDVLTDDLDAPKRYAKANRDYLRGIGY